MLEDYKLDITFADGVSGVVDVSDLVGKGVFALWKNYEEFKQVQIGSTGELIWSDQIDLCPEAIYLDITGKHPEMLFPVLKGEKSLA